MWIFDHFGHLAHGHHAGAFIAIAISVFVAIALPIAFALGSRKDTDS